MSDEESVESMLAAEGFVSPLRSLAIESHEVFTELMAVGFPHHVASAIISQIISDSLLYKAEYDSEENDGSFLGIEIDFDDEDEDPDDLD